MDIILIDAFSYVCVFYFGYILAQAITAYRIRKVLQKLARDQGIDLDNELEKIVEQQENVKVLKVLNLETEIHGDMIYLWDNENNNFICQAKSIEELARLAKEHRNVIGAIVKHGNKVFFFHDGNIKEHEV